MIFEINPFFVYLHYYEKLNELLDHKLMGQNAFHHMIFSHFHDEYYRRYVCNIRIMFPALDYMQNRLVVDEYVQHQHDHPRRTKKKSNE